MKKKQFSWRTVRNLVIGAIVVVPAILADPNVAHLLAAHAALSGYLAGAAAVLEAVVHVVKNGGQGAVGA